jgi:hypothetical protein
MDLPVAFTTAEFGTLLGTALWVGAAIGLFFVIVTLFYGGAGD